MITITKPVFSDNAKKVLKHLQENQGKDETFKDIAKAVHLTDKVTNCIITSSLVEGMNVDPEITVTSTTYYGSRIYYSYCLRYYIYHMRL